MDCTVVYGISRSIRHEETMPVKEAFEFVRQGGWIFYNIYYNNRLVFTTQGCAGYRWICDDCPYVHRKGG